MGSHTPGPWTVVNRDDTKIALISAGENSHFNAGFYIARAQGKGAEANARLIAAAPELFAAVEEAREALLHLDQGALGFVEHQPGPDPDSGYLHPLRDELIAQLDAALAKAIGQ